jgi:hypothetical protein
MANFNSTQHDASVQQGGSLGNTYVLWGEYEITTALTTADTVTFFEAPAGFTCLMGWLIGDDLDTGIETLDIDIGDSGDTDRFLNSGVITGDAVAGIKPAASIWMPLTGIGILSPHTYTTPTNVIGTVVAPAATGGTGTIGLRMIGTISDPRVSPPTAPV